MSDSQQKFYVLRAISGKENKVREYLENEMKTSDLGNYVSQVLIPTEKTFTVRNGDVLAPISMKNAARMRYAM